MRTIREQLIGISAAAIWPAYFGLAAYAARQAPWPRSLAVPVETALALFALAALAANLVRWVFGARGWAEDVLGMPPDVTRQVRRAAFALIAAHLVILLPSWLITRGLIAPGGRPTAAPAVVRGLFLAFEVAVLAIAFALFRRRSALISWLAESPARLGRLARHKRLLCAAVLAGVTAVIVLDARGYSYSAHRMATGAVGSLVVAIVCWGLYRVMLRAIDRHAWQWIRMRHAFARRGEPDGMGLPEDLSARLRRLSAYLAAGIGLLLAAWVWDVDLALFKFVSAHPLWPVDGKDVFVTVGDLARAVFILAACAAAWRHMSTFFAVAIFSRIPDDPGIRFAIVTLCRYAVLGIGLLSGLSAIHLGLEKVGVVLAALGVGLGFGLQEIVSNFVCGIILLLERPIRVGDIVTVGGMTGKIDQINIRATTIINGDNQSIIVPNRAFITGDLINWTLKDKIVRVAIQIKVAPGTDPDQVSELLMAIARDDADVLRNPVPSALMEEFSDSALRFGLSAFVPEPSLAGRVRHRLFCQIQRRFEQAGIQIPLPTQALVVRPLEGGPSRPLTNAPDHHRVDAAHASPTPRVSTPRTAPEPVEDCHRGVDD
jgi:small-conductance mechanosensitive channel